MLEMPILDDTGNARHIASLTLDQVQDRSIQMGDHCYACTAGCGSSCGGALVQ
jgi:3-oxoacyl-[acyl-carrier-protein] synthase III